MNISINKKIYLILLVLSFFSMKVKANQIIEGTNCEYTDSYLEWSGSPEKSDHAEPIMCKSNEKESIQGISINESRFDLRDYEYVNGYRSQLSDGASSGTCWAFGTNNSIESNLLLEGKEEYDLSEAHIALTTQNKYNDIKRLPYKRGITDGGSLDFSTEYLFNRIGPVLEENVNYQVLIDAYNGTKEPTISDLSDADGNLYKPIFSVNEVSRFTQKKGACTNISKENIKKYLITHGALAATFRQSSDYFNKVGEDYYYYYNDSNNSSTNHVVTIIGWDDTISTDKFKDGTRPSNNGAWIVKNTSKDKPQYHYVSYEDILICFYVYGFHNIDFDVEDNTYVIDKLGSYSNITDNDSEYFYVANKFSRNEESKDDEILKKVTINTRLINQKYDIYYSPDGDLSNMEKIYEGYSDKNGYSTIDVSESNIIIKNDYFALAVKYYKKDGKNQIPIYINTNENKYYGLEVEEGKSFMSYDGEEWQNLSTKNGDNGYASIKAYTKNNTLVAKFVLQEGIESISEKSLSCKLENGSCKVVLPQIKAKKGYKVLGWYTQQTSGKLVGMPGDNYKLSSNMTLYARVSKVQEVVVPDTGIKVKNIISILCIVMGTTLLFWCRKKSKYIKN